MIPLKSLNLRQCRHRSHLARMLKHHHHHHHQKCRRRNATGATSRSTALRPERSDWNTFATAKSRKVNVEVGKLLVYVLLIFLTIWNSVICRWWEPSPKRRSPSNEISMNCACFVIFIYMCSTWRQSAYFVVSFRSPSEIILPWCLIISTKSPPFFLPILILKPKVSLTSILSPIISQRHTPDPALFTNIGINWALHTKKSFGSSSKKEKKNV